MTKLEQDILKYQKAYYDGKEIIPDDEYDKLWDRLQKEQPNSELLSKIGEDTVSNNKINHWMVMGSQHKINTVDGFNSWIKNKHIQFPIIISNKLDGNSFELQYENGNLVHGVTRGNGYVGENADRIAFNLPSIPKSIPEKGKIAIRGEIIMNNSVFESKYSKDFKNPRNLTAGLIKNEDFNAFGDLRLIVYDTSKEFRTQLEKLSWLSYMGFDTVEYYIAKTSSDVISYRETRNIHDREYAIDGLVLNQNDLTTDLAISDKEKLRPDSAIAFKWKADSEETALLAVEWSMNGYTLTPIAVFEPVELSGTTVQRASLANPSLIKELGLKIGDRVIVSKRGEIIPKVEEVSEHCGTEEIEIPMVCPICGEPLSLRDNETKLYCSNEECKSHLASRLSKWINVVGAKGFGDVFQEDLINMYVLPNLVTLYNNDFIKNVVSSYYTINAGKAFKDLLSKKNITLSQLIAGFNIDGIGIEMAKILTENGYTLDSLNEATVDDLAKLPNWSNIRANNFLVGFKKCFSEMKEMEKNVNIIQETKKAESGLRICVTGKLNNFTRKSINEFIESKGCIPVDSVSSATDILVTNDPNSGSSKNKNAIKYGTKIVTENELVEMLK